MPRRHVAILPHEAVAIAQKLIKGHCVGDDAEAPFGPLSADTVVIGADGSVQCRASAATPSVSEIAIFLQSLLEGQRVPGGLRYTLGRALLDVDAPPFDSVHDLSVALERFEDGDRDATVAGLVRRASAAGGTSNGRPAGAPKADRRRQAPSSIAALRQELRMADLQLYQARLAAPPSGFGASRWRETKRSSVLSAPVAACMLAGVALVMAGEVSERRAGGSTPSPAPAAVSEPSPAGAASIARTTDIVLPPAVVEPAEPTPASLSDDGAVVRTVASSSKAKSSTRRVTQTRASSGSQGQGRARRVTASRSSERSRKAVEDHDSFIERIRFEWDNPFKRAH